MKFKQVELHGFEDPDTVNVGTDSNGDVPKSFGTQLNLKYAASSVLAVPYRDGKQVGDAGYIIDGRPEGADIVKWYRSEICGIPEPEPEPEPAAADQPVEPDGAAPVVKTNANKPVKR